MWNIQRINSLDIKINEQSVRKIDLELNGINLIIGEVEKNEKGVTSNSLGKTALLDLIDLMFGAKKEKPISKVNGLSTIANYENDITIKRYMGKSSRIEKEGEKITLKELVSFVNRDAISSTALIHKTEREGIYSYNPRGKDLKNYEIFFKIFKLEHLYTYTKEYYDFKAEEEKLKELLVEYELDTQNNKILESEIIDLERKLKLIEDKDDVAIKELLGVKYDEKAKMESKRKELCVELSLVKDKINKLKKYIDDQLAKEETSIELIFNYLSEADRELVKRHLKEVSVFHKKHFQETKVRVEKEILNLNIYSNDLNLQINKLDSKLPSVKKIIESNSELEMIFEEYKVLSKNLQDKKEDFGRLNIKGDLTKKHNNLIENKQNLMKNIKEFENLEEEYEKYASYSSKLVKKFYNNQLNSSFDISIRDEKKEFKYPFKIDFMIDKDDGEGISNVKNIIIDIIAFKFNPDIRVQMWDSKCFNGVDPKQKEKALQEIKKICLEEQKQAILCFNTFQLNDSILKYFEADIRANFNKNDTLLNIQF